MPSERAKRRLDFGCERATGETPRGSSFGAINFPTSNQSTAKMSGHIYYMMVDVVAL